MKLLAVAALVLGLAAGAASAQSLPDGSYRQSCSNLRFDGVVLQADCKTNGQSFRHSAIRVGACPGQKFENNNGVLICDRTGAAPSGNRPPGSYLATCRNIARDGALLQARCKDRNGGWHVSAIDPRSCNDDIGNDDGKLVCQARR